MEPTKTFKVMADRKGRSALSVIIPFVNEWPSIAYTVQAIYEEFRDRGISFEVILVDNWCNDMTAQKREPDRSHNHFKDAKLLDGLPWLRVLYYKDKLSHWQCKNLGAEHSKGDILFFCDAHCLPSRDCVWKAYEYYRDHHEGLNGSLHLPLTYHIMEHRKLMYRLVAKPEKGVLHYKFCSFDESQIIPFKRPCMSTCGMMITRELFNELGGWPRELGIYGGGENFFNWALAVMGKHVWLMPGHPLRHHGDKRGYNWNYDDYHRNRLLATYVTLGKIWAERYLENAVKGSPRRKRDMFCGVLDACIEHRQHIKERAVIDVEDWVEEWESKGTSTL